MTINHYGDFSKVMKDLGVSIYHFRKNVILRHWKNGFELDVSREIFPKKANPEQLQNVYEEVLKLLEIHDKQINYSFRF